MIDVRSIAGRVTVDDIRLMNDEDLLVLADAVSREIGEELVKQSDREMALENKLARELLEDFHGDLDPALEKAIKELPLEDVSPDEVKAALSGVTARMNERDTNKTKEIIAAVGAAILLIARRITRKLVLENPKHDPKVKISASFTQPDLDAIDALAKQQLFWIGDFWSKDLSSRITATVTRESLKTGLGREQVGKIMKETISAKFPSVAVPKTWRGSDESYFKMLSSVVRTRASSFGAINAMADGGIQYYVISAVMDERTSEICRFMDGRTFPVSAGLRHIQATLDGGDPDAVKTAAGWRSPEDARALAGEGSGAKQSLALEAGGMALPPYHGMCRTTVIPA